MATKETQERRLRPIYDALDNQNNKKAVQLVDKVLKKQKDFPCAKALKCLALYRMGRQREAFSLAKSLRSDLSTDEATMQALMMYYRESGQAPEICSLYEQALKIQPKSEEFWVHLFMAYVRVGDFKKQQQTAVSLHKIIPQKNPYYFWGVMSIYLQGRDAADQVAKTVYWPLAQRMVEKYISEEKIEAEAEVRLYLLILIKLDKLEEALQVLQTSLGRFFHSQEEALAFRVQILRRMKRYCELVTIYRAELQKEPEQWSFWTGYLDALTALAENGNKDELTEEQTLSGLVQHVRALLDQREKDEQPPSRTLNLIFLEIIRVIRNTPILQEQAASLDIPSFVDHLVSYIALFGTKTCCFQDIQQFLSLLDKEELAEFVTKATELAKTAAASIKEDSPRDQVYVVVRETLAYQLSRFCGLHLALPVDEKRKLVEELVVRYHEALHLGKDLPATDVQCTDGFILLASHLLVEISQSSGNSQEELLQAMALLEMAIHDSKSNAQLKLTLVKLYTMFGAFDRCASMFNEIQIKHILLETLGYIWSSPVFTLGYFQSGLAMAQMTLASNRQNAESLIAAYRSGSFHKIVEILDFQEELQNSLQRVTAGCLRQSVELLARCHRVEDIVVTFEEACPMVYPVEVAKQWRDLRDLTAVRSWEPRERRLTDEQRKLSFEQEAIWLQLRSCIIRSVCCLASETASTVVPRQGGANNVAKPPSSVKTESALTSDVPVLGSEELAAMAMRMDSGGVKEARSLIERIRDLTREAKGHPGTHAKYPLQGPHPTPLAALVEGDCPTTYASVLEAVILTIDITRTAQGEGQACPQLDSVRETLEKVASGLQPRCQAVLSQLVHTANDQRNVVGSKLEPLVLFAENVSHMLLVSASAHHFIQLARGTSRKAKKKHSTGAIAGLVKAFNAFLESVIAVLSQLLKATSDLRADLAAKKMASLHIELDVQPLQGSDHMLPVVQKHIDDSHENAMGEIADAVKHKITLAESLRLR